ncbi:MAG: ABC transporter permease [Acidobacteria bacterium]|nr:ABC transporter permease [Acidobacteriota bacterium]
MRFQDLLLDTLRTIWAHKLRTFLTMFGIVWGIISITLMIAAGDGFRDGQEKVAEQFGKNILLFFPGRTTLQAGGTRAGRPITFAAADATVVRNEATDCSVVIPELGRTLQVRSPHNSASLLVTASGAEFAAIRTIPIGQGRFYNHQDDREARRVAFIGSDVKTQLFAGREAMGQTISINGLPFTVVGVMAKKEEDSSYDGRDISKVYIPFGAMLRDFPLKPPNNPDAIDRLLAAPPDLEHYAGCKLQVRRALARLHNYDPEDEEAAYCWDTVENTRNFTMMTEGMKYFLGAVGIVTLFLRSPCPESRRSPNHANTRPTPSQRNAVLRDPARCIESRSQASRIGMSTAFGICSLVNLLPMPRYFSGLLRTWQSAGLSFLLLSVVAVLSAIYPASRAAAIDPIEALRYEAGG